MARDSVGPRFVSVIIPVFNDAERLRTCLRALQGQTYPAQCFEVVVVDNASTDDVAGALPDDSRFTLVREPAPGSYAARNTGMDVAGGEVLAFTDSDCVPDPAWLEEAVAALTAEPVADLVGGAMRLFYEGDGPRTGAELYESRHGFPQEMYLRKQSFAVTANMITWRSVVDRVGLFDARLKSRGDVDFGVRVARSPGLLRYAPAAVVRHPARCTTGEIVTRMRRITKGTIDANVHAGARRRRFVLLAARQLYLLARSVVAVLLLGQLPGGVTCKLRYLWVYARLRGVQAQAYLAVALNLSPRSPRGTGAAPSRPATRPRRRSQRPPRRRRGAFAGREQVRARSG